MGDIILRGWNWCKRIRHRKGYGVHSPSDFFFITNVVYEQQPFYAYSSLHHLRRVVAFLPHYREKVDKFLFRLVNYLQPSVLFEVGTGSGISVRYMLEARNEMSVYTFAEQCQEAVKRILSAKPAVEYLEGSWQEKVKELTGKGLEADMFSFTLTGIDGAPMPVDGQATVTAKNTAGGAFDFGEIKYDKVGEYKYEVLEGDSAIGGTKDLTGRDLKDGEFVFQLKDGDKVIAEATNNADGAFAFDGIKIEKVGTYNYTVSEKMNGLGGVEYDKTVYNVRIDASDEGGYIKAKVTYTVNGEPYDNMVFTNAYSYRSTSVQIGAIKKLEGRDLKDGEFTFLLEDAEGNLISKAVNDADGKVVFGARVAAVFILRKAHR